MSEHAVSLTQIENYRFDNQFDGAAYSLQSDEPPPLGDDSGPSPAQLLVAAAANCLSASLLFSARKLHVPVEPLSCRAAATIGRNERNRLRVTRIDVTLQCGTLMRAHPGTPRLMATFEDFCTVSQSIAQGIVVALTVLDEDGSVLKAPPPAED